MGTVVAVVRTIRSLRADLGLPVSAPLAPTLHANAAGRALLAAHTEYVVALARVTGLTIATEGPQPSGAIGTVADGVGISLVIGEGDRPKARRRVQDELQTIRAGLDRVRRRLADPEFAAKAPGEVVEEERRREGDLRSREQVLAGYLATLG